jgi:serine/threonine-protein kinase
MWYSRVWSAAALGLAMLAAAPASPARADNFGAIAYNTETGASGYSHDYQSRDEAEERALIECGPGCEVVTWFRNACASLATGADRGYGHAWAESRAAAERAAIGHCRENSSSCKVAVWVCVAR